ERRAHVERATDTLDRFDDDRGRITRDMLRDRAGLAPRHPRYVKGRARKRVPLLARTPGDRARGGGAAVEAAFDGGDMRSPRHPERHLECVLVRLRAAVDEEHAVVRTAREAQQTRGCALAHR